MRTVCFPCTELAICLNLVNIIYHNLGKNIANAFHFVRSSVRMKSLQGETRFSRVGKGGLHLKCHVEYTIRFYCRCSIQCLLYACLVFPQMLLLSVPDTCVLTHYDCVILVIFSQHKQTGLNMLRVNIAQSQLVIFSCL